MSISQEGYCKASKRIYSQLHITNILTSWLFYYTINNLPVTVNRADFTHPYMVDYVLYIIDKKYGIDTQESLALGATILRQDPDRYTRTVKGRRLYYDK